MLAAVTQLPPLTWIIISSLLMGVIALSGSLTLLMREATLQALIMPLVALAAGSLLGSTFLHIMPAGLDRFGNSDVFYLWLLAGFLSFFLLEQFLHWRHCHTPEGYRKQPLTYLILIGDGLHNFVGGFAIAGIFLADVRLGIMAWLAAAAHEIPQELGDFGVLVHGGYDRLRALFYNLLSALTYLVGGLVAYFSSLAVGIDFLIPFAAGNFLYLGASDLVPEINRHEKLGANLLHFFMFGGGIALMWLIRELFGH
jgi:zinc and cadmium transporter